MHSFPKTVNKEISSVLENLSERYPNINFEYSESYKERRPIFNVNFNIVNLETYTKSMKLTFFLKRNMNVKKFKTKFHNVDKNHYCVLNTPKNKFIDRLRLMISDRLNGNKKHSLDGVEENNTIKYYFENYQTYFTFKISFYAKGNIGKIFNMFKLYTKPSITNIVVGEKSFDKLVELFE